MWKAHGHIYETEYLHIEKTYENIESLCNKKHIRIIAGDFNAQNGPGIDYEKDYVGEHTKGQPNRRGMWLKQWVEQRYGELEKRLTGEHEAAAHEESEILERKDATTTTAAHEESEIPDRQYTTTTAATNNDGEEILEQYTMTLAAAAKEESQIRVRKHKKTTTAATKGEVEILEWHAMKTAVAANDESEIHQQQQVTREKPAAKDVAEILEQKHAATTVAITNEETETLEQRAAATAARKEETIDGKDQELLTLIGRRRNMDRKRQGPSERHQQEDQSAYQRQ